MTPTRYNPKPGDAYGRWTVLSGPFHVGGRRMVSVQCQCGTKQDKDVINVMSGKSNGCRKCRPYPPARPGVKVGERYGSMAVKDVRRKRTSWVATCLCNCGKLLTIDQADLLSGLRTTCVHKENSRCFKHGGTRTRLYGIWLQMRNRCFNPNVRAYPDYGGRGITVCQEWRDSFESFRDWSLSNGYAGELDIDRRNNDGNYEPSNCRWVTRTVNAQNTRKNVYVQAFGERKTLSEWNRDSRIAVSPTTLQRRLARGIPPEQAITLPAR